MTIAQKQNLRSSRELQLGSLSYAFKIKNEM